MAASSAVPPAPAAASALGVSEIGAESRPPTPEPSSVGVESPAFMPEPFSDLPPQACPSSAAQPTSASRSRVSPTTDLDCMPLQARTRFHDLQGLRKHTDLEGAHSVETQWPSILKVLTS